MKPRSVIKLDFSLEEDNNLVKDGGFLACIAELLGYYKCILPMIELSKHCIL